MVANGCAQERARSRSEQLERTCLRFWAWFRTQHRAACCLIIPHRDLSPIWTQPFATGRVLLDDRLPYGDGLSSGENSMHRNAPLIAGLILLSSALPPLAMAHNDPTDWLLSGTGPSKQTNGTDRVSGIYYASESLLLEHTGPTVRGVPTSFFLSIDVPANRL